MLVIVIAASGVVRGSLPHVAHDQLRRRPPTVSVYRSGVVAKHGKEIPLERVNDISFHQSVFERMIGAGDLIIESGGERGQQHFADIRRAAFVQNEIYRQIEASQDRTADRMAADGSCRSPSSSRSSTSCASGA